MIFLRAYTHGLSVYSLIRKTFSGFVGHVSLSFPPHKVHFQPHCCSGEEQHLVRVVLRSVMGWIPSSHRTTVYLVGVQTEKCLVAHSDLYSGPDAK